MLLASLHMACAEWKDLCLSLEKEPQRPFFTCFFGHAQKACAQPSQGVSELMPETDEKNGLAIGLFSRATIDSIMRSATYFGKISAIYQRE